MSEMTGYELSRQWFDFCFENPDQITPTHTALYFFIIEHCNRLGWKQKFGLPVQMAMDAIGVRNYKTYAKAYHDLIDWNFIKLIEKSTNQYSANIIALVKNTKARTKAPTKALTKAMLKHRLKQYRSTAHIDKPLTKEPLTKEQRTKKTGANAPEPVPDFMDQLLGEFCAAYESVHHKTYEVINRPKERKAVAKLLAHYKTKYPTADTEQAMEGMSVYFYKACSVNERWLKSNMSPSLIISKFNEINNAIQHGNQSINTGELEQAARRFADKRKEQQHDNTACDAGTGGAESAETCKATS